MNIGCFVESSRGQRNPIKPALQGKLTKFENLIRTGKTDVDVVIAKFDVAFRNLELLSRKIGHPLLDRRRCIVGSPAIEIRTGRAGSRRRVWNFPCRGRGYSDSVDIDVEDFSDDLRNFDEEALPHF